MSEASTLVGEFYRLTKPEKLWVSYYPFLLRLGYRLRPRYDPAWIPSWTAPGNKRHVTRCEDSLSIWLKDCILDAVRVADGRKVVLKRVPTESDELRILRYLSEPSVASNPWNRTIPILDTFLHPEDPTSTFIVMPYMRKFNYPPFHCRGEFVEAMRQFLEGLQFLHDSGIAHLDIAPKNMMMEESRVVPKGSHFIKTRSHDGTSDTFQWTNRCAVDALQYYYIDFGISVHFPEGTTNPSTTGLLRGFEEIPELSYTVPYNPFKVDAYQFGMMIRTMIKTYPALATFRLLEEKMCSQIPDERPTPREALALLEEIARGMSKSQLRATMWQPGDRLLHRLTRTLCGCYLFDDHTPL
ncbi:kinase-like domain-containing protein [Mycena filopes]|nr:kinase-like domain-containing protein [Mycena filopes]